MKKGWQTKKLGEVCKTGSGGTPLKDRKEYYEGGTIPWLMSGEVSQGEVWEATKFITQNGLDNSAARIFPKDTVLVAMYGATAGQVGILRFEAATNQAVCGIFPNPQFVPEFLFYSLLSKKDELVAQATGNAQPNISQIKIKNTEVPVPPLPEQQRIVGILDEAFEGITTAKANAEKNLQNARALFESHLQSVFTQRGDGWVEKTIGETCVLRSGTTLPKELEKPSGEVPYLKVADMNLAGNLNGVTCSTRYVTRRDVNASNLLPVGTTIFPKRGGAILTNKKRLTTCVICADLNIMGVTPKQFLLPAFLFNYFLNLDLREINNGSSIPQINNYSIEPLTIAFPHSMEEQQAIVDLLNSLATETQRLSSLYERKLAALEALKKSLLHQAFTGQLTSDNG